MKYDVNIIRKTKKGVETKWIKLDINKDKITNENLEGVELLPDKYKKDWLIIEASPMRTIENTIKGRKYPEFNREKENKPIKIEEVKRGVEHMEQGWEFRGGREFED